MRLRSISARLLVAGMVLVPLFAMAADDQPDYATQTLSGDWGGARSAMYRNGLATDIGYKVDLLRNMSGGIEKGGRPMTHLDIDLAFDFGRLFNWSGGSGDLNVIYDSGDRFNERHVGSLTGVSNIEVPVNTQRIFQAWLQQNFIDGRGSILVGLYPIDTEFQVVDSAALFLQPPYGASADLALTRGPSIFNTSSFGLRGKWLSADRSAYVQGAILDGMPGDPADPYGTHIKFQKGDGTFSIVEVGLKPGDAVADKSKTDNGPAPAEDGERFEKYAAGLWRYSARVPDLIDTNADGTPVDRLSWGWYALTEKTLYQGGGGRDLTGFVRISGTDGNSTAIRTVVNIGIRVKAPIPGRGDDVFGLAYTRAALSGKWRSAQLAAGTQTNSAEDAWEITYRIQVTKWITVQPDIQHINHPGGDASRAAANIVGARIEFTL